MPAVQEKGRDASSSLGLAILWPGTVHQDSDSTWTPWVLELDDPGEESSALNDFIIRVWEIRPSQVPAFKIKAKCVFSLCPTCGLQVLTALGTWQLKAVPSLLLHIWKLPGWDSSVGSAGPGSRLPPVLCCLGLGSPLGSTPGILPSGLPMGLARGTLRRWRE